MITIWLTACIFIIVTYAVAMLYGPRFWGMR